MTASGSTERRDSRQQQQLRILSINDVYTLDNLPRLRELYRAKEAEAGAGVAVVRTLCGDFLSPNVLSPIDSGFSFVRCFNAVGVTHYCFGNHEANLHLDQLEERFAETAGVVVNSNIPSYDRPKLPAFSVVELGGGVKVGVLGVLTTSRKVFPRGTFKKFPIEDTIATTRVLSRALKEEHGCAAVVAMTHQSMADDRALAAATDLAVILGGHEHSAFDETVGSCRIIKTGKDAQSCGVVDVVVTEEAEGAKVKVHVEYHLEAVDDYDEDPQVKELVRQCYKTVEVLDHEVMIRADRALTATGSRFRQTDIGALVGDYVNEELESEVTLVNGATIKAPADFPSGCVSMAELHTALPFPTKLVVVGMRGAVLQEALRFSRRNGAWASEKRGFLQVDGGVEVAHPTVSGSYGPAEMEEEHDTIVSIGGAPFDAQKEYRVALPRNLLNGFCEIEPLVRFWQEEAHVRELDEDNYIPALDVVLRRCFENIWGQLGEFEDIDRNNDNKLSRRELQARLEQLFGNTPSEIFINGLIDSLDVDGDGFISRAEFARLKKKV